MSWPEYPSAGYQHAQYTYAQPQVSQPIAPARRSIDASCRLPPILRLAASSHPQAEHILGTQAPSKALKIADLLSYEDVVEVKKEVASRVLQTVASPTPLHTIRQIGHPAPRWDDFIKSLATSELDEQQKSIARPLSRDQCSEKASLGSILSQMSSPSAYSTESCPLLSPLIPAGSPTDTRSAPPLYDYKLLFRQQPVAARACGHGDRDRRVIDPPPILELKITRQMDHSPTQDSQAIFALHCSLIDAETGKRAAQDDVNSRMMSSMMGASAASPFHGKDEYGIVGTFFIFSDLSCRYQGRFRLRFELLRIDSGNMQPGARHGIVATVETNIFTAYTAKDFPGMQASTALLKALRRQGLTVGIKKGSEARKLKSKFRQGSSASCSDSDTSVFKAAEKRRVSRDDSSAGRRMITAQKRVRRELDPVHASTRIW